MNTKTIIPFAMALLMITSGCLGLGSTEQEKSQKQLSDATGENLDNVTPGGSFQFEVKVTEKNQIQLVKSQPPFLMEHSLERENLINRYKYLNDRNNVHHVYITGNNGDVISYFVAQGKVSSVNSKLTNDKQIVFAEGCHRDRNDNWGYASGACFKTVESPQMDGSYGTNGDAIFFFTTSGEYVQTNHKYVVSEEPLNINTPISLEQQVDEDGEDDNETSEVVVI